jgi:uncharacterized protein (TIGR03089 family)
VPASTFTDLLTTRLGGDAARPLVTFYDDATGERVELSAATYGNWVAKTAGLVQDELDVEHGATLLVDLPTHWLGAVWLGAAWAAGLVVTDDRSRLDEAAAVVCGPPLASEYVEAAGRVPVIALSLRPLGARFAEPLPSGVTDYGAVALAQPDVFAPARPATGEDVAWVDAAGEVTQRRLVQEAAGGGVVADGGRLLTDVNPASREGLGTLLGPLAQGGSTVWVRNPDRSGWSRRREVERATDERLTGQPPRS